jgi:hypothetical protein
MPETRPPQRRSYHDFNRLPVSWGTPSARAARAWADRVGTALAQCEAARDIVARLVCAAPGRRQQRHRGGSKVRWAAPWDASAFASCRPCRGSPLVGNGPRAAARAAKEDGGLRLALLAQGTAPFQTPAQTDSVILKLPEGRAEVLFSAASSKPTAGGHPGNLLLFEGAIAPGFRASTRYVVFK